MTALLGSPFTLDGVELANRVVFGPHVTLYATHDGRPTDRLGDYLAARARGRVGLIVTGSQHVHPSGGGPGTVRAYDADAMAGWAPIVERCHRHGTRVIAQLSHHGPEAVSTFTGQALRSASAVANPIIGEVPAPLTPDEIAEIVEAFATSAANAVAVGFDGVEIKAGHDGLLRPFLSPRSNLRTDHYGGTPENRVRFPAEVVAAVRAAVPDGVAVGVRLCLDERLPGGYGLDDAVGFARALVEAGAGYLASDVGTWESMEYQIPPMAVPHGHTLDLSATLRAGVGVPVVASGRIHTPAEAEAALAAGQADLVALARPLIADADWAAKAFGGAADRIRPCVACNQLCLGNLIRELPIGCVHNPAAGREAELGAVPEVPARRVVVVGGGPAGLKAAETAARAGHAVTLFEAGPRVGGQVRVAAGAPGHGEWGGIVDHLEAELHHLGVDVRLGRRAGVDDVLACRPDTVVVATGSVPAAVPFPAEDVPVVDQWRAMADPPRDLDVVLFDTARRYEGAALAETLAAAGNRLRWVSPAPWPAFEVDPASAAPLRRSLDAHGVEVCAQRVVVGADADGVTVVDVVTGQVERLAPADVVVLAGNKAADAALADELTASERARDVAVDRDRRRRGAPRRGRRRPGGSPGRPRRRPERAGSVGDDRRSDATPDVGGDAMTSTAGANTYHQAPASVGAAPPGCPVHTSWNPLGDDYLADPYPIAARLREDHPVFYAEEIGYVVVTRMEDIEAVFTDPDTFASTNVQDPLFPLDPAAAEVLAAPDFDPVAVMSNRPEPDHGRIRVHTRKGFSNRRLKTLRDYMERRAGELVDAMLAGGPPAEYVAAVAFPLPAEIVFRFIGFPESDDAMIKSWCVERKAFSWGRPTPEQQVEIAEHMLTYWRYCRDFTASRRDHRADDFASELLDAHEADPEALTYREVESVIYGLSFAGHDPVTNLLCNSLLTLLPRRDQWEHLIADRNLIPNAVDEVLRYESSQIAWRRVTTRDTTLAGVDLPAGTRIFLNFAAANRQPGLFDEPDSFDITRPNANRHISFGKGIHYCLGAGLSKMEAAVLLDVLADRVPSLRLVDEQDTSSFPNITFRGPQQLLVAWDR